MPSKAKGTYPSEFGAEDMSFIMEADENLLLFTDGITEAFSPQGEEFGDDRIAAVAQTNRAPPAQRISDI